jgi:tetratricopeptide (TPR) repeat protein
MSDRLTRRQRLDIVAELCPKHGVRRPCDSFERARERAPQNPIYHYHLGLAYKDFGDARRARAAFERALELRSDFPGAEDARSRLTELRAAASR